MPVESSIDFYCVLCGECLGVGLEMAGGVVECPKCARVVPVPGPLKGAASGAALPVFPRQVISVEISFICPECERVLVADARYAAAPFQCPKCTFSGHVPIWSRMDAGSAPGNGVPALILTREEIELLTGNREETLPAILPAG